MQLFLIIMSLGLKALVMLSSRRWIMSSLDIKRLSLRIFSWITISFAFFTSSSLASREAFYLTKKLTFLPPLAPSKGDLLSPSFVPRLSKTLFGDPKIDLPPLLLGLFGLKTTWPFTTLKFFFGSLWRPCFFMNSSWVDVSGYNILSYLKVYLGFKSRMWSNNWSFLSRILAKLRHRWLK